MDANYIRNFINSLGYKGECKKLSEVLLKTRDDCDNYYKTHLGRELTAIGDLLKYREHKMSVSRISMNDFVKMYAEEGVTKSVEELTLHKCSKSQSEVISLAINSGRVDISCIYEHSMKNPNENILKNIL